MSKAIASRIAGVRLAAIMVILLVPILLLSVLTLRGMQADIGVAEKQIIGNQLAKHVMAMAIQVAEQKATDDSLANDFAAAATSAAELGLQKQLLDVQTKVFAVNSDGAKLAHLVGFVRDIGTRSELLLDGQQETSFLALSIVDHLPPLLLKFHGFHNYLQDAIASSGIDQTEVKLLSYRMGTLGEAVDRARYALQQARAFSPDPQAYDEALVMVDKIGKGVSVTMDVMASSAPGSEWLTLSMISQQNIDAAGKYKSERVVWEKTTQRLDQTLAVRLSDLKRKLLVLMGIAAACVLVAGLAAYSMFSSTLKRLDTVESEKRRADAARIEAEQMGARVAGINEEITALNLDLSANMQKLKSAQDELLLKGRMEQLGQLTATVAHEIRNPLGSVRTCAFLIARKVKGKGLGVEDQLERINKGVARCDGIITQLLDFSRTKEVNTKPSDLDAWLESVLREDIETFPASVQITCELGLAGKDVHFDQQRLRRAVINLLNNSCEAMVGNGQQTSTMTVANPEIRISTFFTGDKVSIQIADNGPGMTEEVLARIREPLFTTKNFGTGLGVPAVEQITHQHGGELLISSTPGVGSMFTICIPSCRANQKEAA